MLCAWCMPDAVPVQPSRCYRCHVLSQDSETCSKCRSDSPLRYVWVRGTYEAAAKELIYRMKFERAKAASLLVAELMDESIPYLPTDTVVTYVPTATSRIRTRGYDQSKLLAKGIAKQRDLQLQNLLIRRGQSRQVGSSRKHRIEQATHNYLTTSSSLNIDTVLLIDDITTTGATIEAAAKQLKQAGVKRVYGAVFAQKQ